MVASSVPLSVVVRALEELAPLRYAESWDNVGLLLEPPSPRSPRARSRGATPVRNVLLCIDLVEAVAAEALRARAELVVAYHPPIFAGLQRLTVADARVRGLLRLVQAGVCVWSPHTALDAVAGGVNDWLADGLGDGEREVLQPVADAPAGVGQGRRVRLQRAVSLPTLLARIKRHLGVDSLRVAGAAARRGGVREVGLVPGAGGGTLLQAHASRPFDLLLTGEMRHHDVLAAVESGAAVVLTEHSSCERGYLARLARALGRLLPGVRIRVSRVDRDPLRVA